MGEIQQWMELPDGTKKTLNLQKEQYLVAVAKAETCGEARSCSDSSVA